MQTDEQLSNACSRHLRGAFIFQLYPGVLDGFAIFTAGLLADRASGTPEFIPLTATT